MSVRPVVYLHTIMQLRVALTVDNLDRWLTTLATRIGALETGEKMRAMKIYLSIYLYLFVKRDRRVDFENVFTSWT